MIGWEYPPHNSGGLGVATEGITKELANQNTEVFFTLPYHYSGTINHLHVVECVPDSWGKTTAPPFSGYGQALTQPSAPLRLDVDELVSLPSSDMECRVAEYATEVAKKGMKLADKFEVIHAHDWMSFPAATQLKQQTGKPMIAHVHSTEYDRIPSGNGSPFIIQAEKEGFQAADKIIAVSAYTKHVLINHYQIDPQKIAVVHNGIAPVDPIKMPGVRQFATKRPVVVFMGRLTAQKGPTFFLDVANQVLDKLPEVLFVVAGVGDMYQELLWKTAGDHLTASVLFSGFVRDTQKNKLLDRADVFVMPSLSEPFGLVALEAAQRHTPVIISKTSGASEVLPNAIRVDYWDTQALTAQIIELLANPARRETLVKSQLSDLKKVTWQKAARAVRNLYQSLFH